MDDLKNEKLLKFKKEKGNVGDLVITGVMMLVMTVLMVKYIGCMEMINTKSSVDQLARRYLLLIETKGCLEESQVTELNAELANLGITDIDLTGTTIEPVGYGEMVSINISGKLQGRTEIHEVRTSTAKN